MLQYLILVFHEPNSFIKALHFNQNCNKLRKAAKKRLAGPLRPNPSSLIVVEILEFWKKGSKKSSSDMSAKTVSFFYVWLPLVLSSAAALSCVNSGTLPCPPLNVT